MCLAQLTPLLLHCEFQAVMPFPKTVHPNQGNYFCRALLSSFVSQLLFLLKNLTCILAIQLLPFLQNLLLIMHPLFPNFLVQSSELCLQTARTIVRLTNPPQCINSGSSFSKADYHTAKVHACICPWLLCVYYNSINVETLSTNKSLFVQFNKEEGSGCSTQLF